MKRDSNGASLDGPASKFSKVDADLSNVGIRFLIPGRAAGIMIGKGGDNIKKIRSQYNVKLNIPDSRGPERIMTIEGDLQSICDIMKEVSPKLKDIMSAKLSDPKRIMGAPPRGRGRPDEPDRDGDDEMIDFRILVHESQAGSVIGRGGERIKNLRDRFKMRVIKVYQMLAPMSTDRVVQMVAEPDNVIQCLYSVVSAVESAPPRGRRQDYDTSNYSEPDALNYGGWLSREAIESLSQGVPLHGGPMGYNNMGGGGGPMGGSGGPMYGGRGGGRGYRGGGMMRGGGGPNHGSRGMMGGPAPVPPPRGGGHIGGGNCYGGSMDAYGDQGGYDGPEYDNGGYGGPGHSSQGYSGPGGYGSNNNPMSGPGGYGNGSSYGGPSQRGSGEPLPNSNMPARGGYGGGGGNYGGVIGSGVNDGAKVNQWYGGWS